MLSYRVVEILQVVSPVGVVSLLLGLAAWQRSRVTARAARLKESDFVRAQWSAWMWEYMARLGFIDQADLGIPPLDWGSHSIDPSRQTARFDIWLDGSHGQLQLVFHGREITYECATDLARRVASTIRTDIRSSLRDESESQCSEHRHDSTQVMVQGLRPAYK